MVDELNAVLATYQQKWQQFVAERHNQDFFGSIKPIAAGWKVADEVAFDAAVPKLKALSDRVHLSWVNERWLGSFHLKNKQLAMGMGHIKLMQRRPNSSDALGLDHVDFLLNTDGQAAIEQLLILVDWLDWQVEMGDLCEWISIRFAGTEAKLRFPSQTTIDAVLGEWMRIKKEMLE